MSEQVRKSLVVVKALSKRVVKVPGKLVEGIEIESQSLILPTC